MKSIICVAILKSKPPDILSSIDCHGLLLRARPNRPGRWRRRRSAHRGVDRPTGCRSVALAPRHSGRRRKPGMSNRLISSSFAWVSRTASPAQVYIEDRDDRKTTTSGRSVAEVARRWYAMKLVSFPRPNHQPSIPIPMPSLHAVAFDLDGLMFNTEDVYWKVGTELMRRRGRKYDKALSDAVMGRPPRYCFEKFIEWHSLDDSWEDLRDESEENLRQPAGRNGHSHAGPLGPARSSGGGPGAQGHLHQQQP